MSTRVKKRVEHGTANISRKLKNQYFHYSGLACICALVLVILGWGDGPGLTALGLGVENSFYNLLIQGFDHGQLNIIKQAPVELTQLTNPYDPALNGKFLREFGDMSYYKGKLYVYYGVAPAIVLYWPYHFLTLDYLSDRAAVFIFLSTGFLALAFLLTSIWKRYFKSVGFWVLGLCLLTVGTGISTVEAEWWWSDVYEVAQSSGFAFTMLSVAAIWQAMHQTKRKIIWLLLASLAYGLAVASRSSLLFGAIILLVPMIYEWRNSGKTDAYRKMSVLFLAIACPIAVVGAGLMIYNYLRFGNVFDFGWQYCLGSGTYEEHKNGQFHLQFLWYNFYYYFLEPMRWTAHFPFLQTFDPPTPPIGHAATGKDCGGILLVNFPLALAAMVVPLAWKRNWNNESVPLRLLVIILSILIVTSASVLCLFCIIWSRYELDFLPALMILSVIGIFSLEQGATGAGRQIARYAWCLLVADTLAFNTMASVEGYATADYFNGNQLIRNGQPSEAVKYLENAARLSPGDASYHKALGTAYQSDGMFDKAIVQYEKALAIDPDDAGSQYFLGSALYWAGQSAEAIKHFDLALKLDPHCFDTYGDYGEHTAIAWSFATNADPSKRDASLAIKFAECACRETGYQMAIVVGTLAAAYAEAGRYDDAVATARKAIAVAEKGGDPNILQRNRDFLALYLKRQPFHQNGPTAESGAGQLNTTP